MARLQILELPEGNSDDAPPYLLVIDEVTEDEAERLVGSHEAVDGVAKKAGARAVAVFHGMTVDIPANEPMAATSTDDPERAGIAQIVYAHERTRLDLCSALLVSGDTTWRKIIETVSERQRELAGLYKERDTLAARLRRIRSLPEQPKAVDASIKEPDTYRHAYRVAIGNAKFVARGGDEEAINP